jgi:hypothetical protein
VIRNVAAFAALVVLCLGSAIAAVAQSPAATGTPLPSPSPAATFPPGYSPVVLNEHGTYVDAAAWMYKGADGLFSNGPAVKGTNESLPMPSPEPSAGATLAGVTLIRHRFDTLGYPLHIALIEKLFAAAYQIPIFVAWNGELWKHDAGDPIAQEEPVSRTSRPAFKYWGPFHADEIPFDKAPEPELQSAFAFAKSMMSSIRNMPESQKDLGNYGVFFVDDGQVVWVELGPRFGPDEAPHLGCQTQLGRDMVIGYDKKQPSGAGRVGKFLQCF